MANPSTIKNLDVRATWHGLQDEFVQVNISITIDGQPDSRVPLLDITNEFMANASVQSIQRVPSIATALVPKAVQHSSDFSGDTLMTSDAHEFFDTIRTQEVDPYHYESDERYDQFMDDSIFYESDERQDQLVVNNLFYESDERPDQVMNNDMFYESDERHDQVTVKNTFWPTPDIEAHSRGILGDPSNRKRAEDPLYLPLHTPCVGNYMARGELNTPKRAHRLFPPVRPGASPPVSHEGHSQALLSAPYPNSEVSSGRSRSTSGGTVEIHPLPSPTSSNTSRSECISQDSRSSTPSDSSTPRRSKLGDRAKDSTVKPPWRSPIYQDFALKKKSVLSPSHSTRYSSTGKSSSPQSASNIESVARRSSPDELKPNLTDSSNNPSNGLKTVTERKLSKLKQQPYTVGRANGRKFKPNPKDEILNYKYYGKIPLFARSCHGFPSTSSDDGAEDTSDLVSNFEDANPTESILVLKQPALDRLGNTDQESMQPRIRLPSTDLFPRVWLRREDSSRRPSVQNPNVPRASTTEATWVEDNGKLYLIFARDMTAGIYEVVLEANLNLPKPDQSGWQSIKIAGLPGNDGKDTTGGFEFILKAKLDTVALPKIQYDTSRLLDARTLGSKELIARFQLLEPLLLRLRSKEGIHDIDNWNAAVTLHTVPRWSSGEGTQMKHHATLTFELPENDFYAEKVRFSVIVSHGPSKGRACNMEIDEGSLSLANDFGLDSGPEPYRSEAEITIVRSFQNLEDPINLYFVLSYPDREYVTMTLPTFRPKMGKVLSECIMLLKHLPPLSLDHLAKGLFSTWKKTESYQGEDTWMRLHRVEVCPLFPEGLQDDAMVRIRKLCPVHYESLVASDGPLLPEYPSNVVKEIDIRIEKVFGEELQCRMSLELEVGSSCRLLTVDDHDWIPLFFLINGRLATEKAGEWRVDEDGYTTLFRSATMKIGQTLKLEMYWKELFISDEFKGEGAEKTKIEYMIPRILGKVILGGAFLCRIDEGTVILSDGEKEMSYHFLDLYSLDTTRLPKMQPGYNMTLSLIRHVPCCSPSKPVSESASSLDKVRFSGGFPLSRRTVRFEDEKSESSSGVSETTASIMSQEEDTESTVSSAFDEYPEDPPTYFTQISNLALVRCQHPQSWTDRAKKCMFLTYLLVHWLVGYVLVGYMLVLLTSIGSGISSDARGSVGYFDPNNIISDLLPSPVAKFRHYLKPLQNDDVHNTSSNGESHHYSGDLPLNPWDETPEEETATGTEQTRDTSTGTKVAYIDWIDRALGWKGVKE